MEAGRTAWAGSTVCPSICPTGAGLCDYAVLTLALGIGINTAVFSVIDTVLLQKPPLADPDRLVTLQQRFPRLGDIGLGAAPAEYLNYRDRNRVFSSVAGYEDALLDLTGGTETVHVQAQPSPTRCFPTVGVQRLVGPDRIHCQENSGPRCRIPGPYRCRLKPGVSLVQAEQDAGRVADDFQRDHQDICTGNLRLRINVDPPGAREAACARPVLMALAGAVI